MVAMIDKRLIKQTLLTVIRADSLIAKQEQCFICRQDIQRGCKLMRILSEKFVHWGPCRNRYIARLAVVYELNAKDIMVMTETTKRKRLPDSSAEI